MSVVMFCINTNERSCIREYNVKIQVVMNIVLLQIPSLHEFALLQMYDNLEMFSWK